MGQSFYILSLVKVIISDSNRIISAQKVMDFQPFIDEYKEGDAVSSPIWIWFIKEDNSSKCQICSQTIARKAYLSRQSNPIHAMVAHGKDCPRVYKLFRKYSVFPATQNCDERLFSMVNRNTGALSWNIKVETIERKVVIGSAIQRHGFIFHYKNGNISSSDDEE